MVHFVDVLQFVYDCLVQSVTSRSREFCFFWMVPVSVPENLVLKKGTGKMLSQKQYRYRYWKEFGTSTGKLPGIFHFLGGTGISTEKNGPGKKYRYRKKLVPKKCTGTGKNSGCRHTLV